MYRKEVTSESPNIEMTGVGTDPVRAKGPESSRGKKLISFGNLFGLQDTLVHFGGERRIPEEKCTENNENDAVPTLSLSVQ